MKKRMAVVLVMVIGLACSLFAADEKVPVGPTVVAQGLHIVKPALSSDGNQLVFKRTGVTVDLLVSIPQGGLVSFDQSKSKITAFTDDKGKDLTKVEGKNDFQEDGATFGSWLTIHDDRKSGSMDLCAPGMPTKGASSLTVTGEFAVQVATKKKEDMSEVVVLKKDNKITVGGISFVIKKTGKPQWGDADAFSVTLEAKQSLEHVVEIQFYDADGKKIESSRLSSQISGMGDNVTETREYQLKKKVDSAKIGVLYWVDKKTVVIPFKLSIGLGL